MFQSMLLIALVGAVALGLAALYLEVSWRRVFAPGCPYDDASEW